MANTVKVTCFDLVLVGGLIYLFIDLGSSWNAITCHYPLKYWLLQTYINILLLRIVFFFFELNPALMRCSSAIMVFFMMPFHFLWTILGSVWLSK